MSSILSAGFQDPRAAAVAAATSNGASGASGAAASSGSSTAAVTQQFSTSDFMTLLVAEMKNQDPTAPTDPTQFVQQLVGVNSLQQLIQINHGINGTASTSTSTFTSQS